MPVSRKSIARLVAAAITTALALPMAVGVAPAAAYECTGWSSTSTPPPTIRVLRSSGVVQRVDFRKYVEVVMAAEWPSFYPTETLKAAAVAVKQYGWYYAMNGRSWYVTSSGACYDVKDTTADQLYQPEKRTPTAAQKSAVAATWGITVRKNGRFFLTGYRSGEFVNCGADADGFRLYAHSAYDCGKKGMTRAQIQHRYYDPGLTIVGSEAGTAPSTSDTTAPTVTTPVASVKMPGTLGKGLPVVSWTGSDAGSGIERYQLQVSKDGGTFTNVTLPSATATKASPTLYINHSYRFRVRAIDRAGNVGAFKTGPAFTLVLHENTSSAMTYTPSWARQAADTASGGSVTWSQTAGARATLNFTGRTVAYIAHKGPTRGSAQIYVDDALVGTVNLYASSTTAKQVLFVKNWTTSSAHKVVVRVVGTSGRPRVDVDTFLVYR